MSKNPQQQFCIAYTAAGKECRNPAMKSSKFCHIHLRQLVILGLDLAATAEIKEQFKAYMKRKHRWEHQHPGQIFPEPKPKNFRWVICGARTRSGGTCNRQDISANGRCRLHGGLSTGPKTKEGKARSAGNGFTRTPWKGK